MEITLKNRKRYIRKVLKHVLKKYYFKWLGKKPFRTYFTLEEAVNVCSKAKINIIKEYIYENSYLHKNLWYVYQEIKYFHDIKDLLYYISLKSCYNAETILLQILRGSKNFYIKNGDDGQTYLINTGVRDELEHTDDLESKIKTFVRYYTKLLLNIKKRPKLIHELYNLVINEELSYDSARNGDIILEIINQNHKSIEDLIKLTSDDNLKYTEEIFSEIIRKDHNHFFRIIDDYYGSKDWDQELKFRGYFKLFDQYHYEKKYEKANILGGKVLEFLENSGLSDRQKDRIQRLIKKNMKGG